MFAVIKHDNKPDQLQEESKSDKNSFVWYHASRKRFELVVDIKSSGLEVTKDMIVEDLVEPIEVGIAIKASSMKCNQCDFETDNLGGMRRHIAKMHGSGSFTDVAGQVHEWGGDIVISETPPKSVPQTEQLKCNDCDFTTDNLGGMRKHISKMHKNGSYTDSKGEVIQYGVVEIEVNVPSKPKPRPKVLL